MPKIEEMPVEKMNDTDREKLIAFIQKQMEGLDPSSDKWKELAARKQALQNEGSKILDAT